LGLQGNLLSENSETPKNKRIALFLNLVKSLETIKRITYRLECLLKNKDSHLKNSLQKTSKKKRE
jgi:hypothetical protein